MKIFSLDKKRKKKVGTSISIYQFIEAIRGEWWIFSTNTKKKSFLILLHCMYMYLSGHMWNVRWWQLIHLWIFMCTCRRQLSFFSFLFFSFIFDIIYLFHPNIHCHLLLQHELHKLKQAKSLYTFFSHVTLGRTTGPAN